MKEHIINMENTEGWKLYQGEVEKIIEGLNKELLREGRGEAELLNDKLNERIYTYYDVIALARAIITKKIGGINTRLKNGTVILSDQSTFL